MISHHKTWQRCSQVAHLLSPIKGLFAYVAFLSLVALLASLLFNVINDVFQVPLLLVSSWSLMAFIFVSVFNAPLPNAIEHDGFFTRIKVGIQRFFYFLVMLVTLTLTAVILILTFRLILVWYHAI